MRRRRSVRVSSGTHSVGGVGTAGAGTRAKWPVPTQERNVRCVTNFEFHLVSSVPRLSPENVLCLHTNGNQLGFRVRIVRLLDDFERVLLVASWNNSHMF